MPRAKRRGQTLGSKKRRPTLGGKKGGQGISLKAAGDAKAKSACYQKKQGNGVRGSNKNNIGPAARAQGILRCFQTKKSYLLGWKIIIGQRRTNKKE